jgi:hypothetical protein
MATRQFYITGDTNSEKVGGTNYEAQTFTVETTHRIMAVLLKIGEVSASDYAVEIAIQAVDENGKPDNTDLILSENTYEIAGPGFGGSGSAGQWIECSFGAGYVLTAGVTYAIVLRVPDGNTTSEYWIWRRDATSPTYAGGSRFHSANSGTAWTEDTTKDYMFAERDGRRLHTHIDDALGSGETLNDQDWYSQSFIPGEDFTLYSVAIPLYIGAADTPGALTVDIYAADVNDRPTGSALATGTLSAAYINALTSTPSAAVWSEVTFSTPLDVTSGTSYCIVAHADDAGVGEDVFWSGTITASSFPTLEGAYSVNAGSAWTGDTSVASFRCYGANFQAPLSDQKVVTRIVEAVGNEIWYGSGESLQRLDASVGELDTSLPIQMFELDGKCFIANGTNLKVADFVNIKITSTNVGSHPPDHQTVLTGGTSGAQMVVDYIDAVSGAVVIYGKLMTTAEFEAETVTGTDDDGNSISFTGTAQVTGPHWYDWTVWGGSSVYGVMPTQATLGKAWRGRPVLTGDKDYPQYWYMGRQANPYDWNYISLDSQSPVASDNADAGQTGEPIIAAVPYNRDRFIFGCTNSIWFLQGDPADGGSLLTLDDSAGFLAAEGWCWDKRNDLYVIATTGILRIPNGFGIPENITAESYPDFIEDLNYDSTLHKLTCGYDRLKDGFKICKTVLATGVNENWWFDIRKKGLFPETYPTQCGVYCLHWYEALDPDYRCLLHGSADGFIRWEDPTAVDDNIGDTDQAINSYVTFGPFALSKENREGVITDITPVTVGSRLGTLLTDSSAVTLKVWAELAADDIVERFNSNALPKLAATVSAPGRGRGQTIRREVRGAYSGLRLGNSTAAQTWGLEELILNSRDAGKV